MDTVDTIIRGNIVLPEDILTDGYVAVSQGTITRIDTGIPPRCDKVFDVRGRWILPGIIDGHVHSGSQAGREGIAGITKAAAAGGVTTIADMPYDDPQPVTDAQLFKQKVAVVNQQAFVDVALFGTMTKENGVDKLPGMIDAGACAFKFSTFETHPMRFPSISPLDLQQALKVVGYSDLACCVHSEHQEIVDTLIAEMSKNDCCDSKCHGLSRPPISESLAIAEVYELGMTSGGHVHVVHCSIGRGIELCDAYRQQGLNTSIETCVHYLTLCEDDLEKVGAFGKVNPPLRSNTEVEKLWRHLAAGRINYVVSDHVAWGRERKSNPNFLQNASGFPGLESLLPAFFTGCVQHNLPINTVARYLSEGPARQFLLYPQKGVLSVGSDADITVFEETNFTFDSTNTQTAADWSPFDGVTFLGRVVRTFVHGEQVWDGKQILARPGHGRFVHPIYTQSGVRFSPELYQRVDMGSIIQIERMWSRIQTLAEFTDPQRPYTRRSFSVEYRKSRSYLQKEFKDAGLDTWIDAGGNLIGRLEGKNSLLPPLVTGSHSDTVVDGGRFDGIAGVIAALEVAQALTENHEQLHHPLEVIDFLGEEPSEYGVSMHWEPGAGWEYRPRVIRKKCSRWDYSWTRD